MNNGGELAVESFYYNFVIHISRYFEFVCLSRRGTENEEGRITREKRRERGEDENLKITAMLPRSVVIETELKPGATPNNPKLVTLRRV